MQKSKEILSSGNFLQPRSVTQDPTIISAISRPPSVMKHAHWHTQFEINFIAKGRVTYQMHNHRVDLAQGDICVFWGGLSHQMISKSNDAEFVAIHLPLRHFFQLRLSMKTRGALMVGKVLILNHADGSDVANFDRWVRYLSSEDKNRQDHATEEILLRIERSYFESFSIQSDIDTHDGEAVRKSQHIDFRNIDLLSSFVAEHFLDDIDSIDIARAANIHPKYAMRVFKISTGMTLNAYVNLLRISYAQAHLIERDRNILTIAMDSGFKSLSAFNASFKRISGTSPSQFRRTANARRVAASAEFSDSGCFN